MDNKMTQSPDFFQMPPASTKNSAKSDFGTIAKQWPANYLNEPTSLLASELQERRRLALDFLAALPAGSGLEIGCGAGEFSIGAAALGHAVSAFDQSSDMVTAACAALPLSARVSFSVASVTEYSYPKEAVDWTAALGVLEWLDESERAWVLGRFAEILKPGGRAIVSIPNLRSPARKFDRAFRYCWRRLKSALGISHPQDAWNWTSFEPGKFCKLWQEKGFEVEKMAGVSFFPQALDRVSPRFGARLFRLAPSSLRPAVATRLAGTLLIQFRRCA